MCIKVFLPLLLTMFSPQIFGQSAGREFKVMENGEEVNLPDSLQTKIEADSTQSVNLLKQWYGSQGFMNAEIDSLSRMIYRVNRGCRFDIAELEIKYFGAIDTVRTLANAGNFSKEDMEQQIRQLIFEMEEEGYLYAKSKITELKPNYEACTVQVQLEIETGAKAESAQIYFDGTDINSQEYLRRISRFRSDEILHPQYLGSLRSNLVNSGLFSSVGNPEIFTSNGETIVILQVEERSLNQFDGLIGYVPNSAGEGQFVGDAKLSLWNVLFQGNGINFSYQRPNPERSRLITSVSQSWIGDIPIGVRAGFQLEQNDTTYQARHFSIDTDYQFSSGFGITGGVEYQNTTSGQNLLNTPEPDGRRQIARLGFQYSNLSNFEVPTSGFNMMISWGVANKDLEDDSTSSFIQRMLEFRIQNYFPLSERSIITPSLHVFFLDADKVTLHDLINFGGTNSFRGYAEDQFRAGTMVWGDIEYRFMINRFSYLFGFVAAGGYERPQLLTEETSTFHVIDYLYSGGLGISYRTAIGQVRFIYALSPEESIGNGKIHFGIRTAL